MRNVTARAADPAAWQLVEPVALPQPIRSATTLVLEAVPLQEGVQTPALRVGYTVGDQQQDVLVRAAQAVDVRPVTEAVTVTFLDGKPTRVGETVTLTLMVQNASPFILTNVEAVPFERGLRWEQVPKVFTIPPGEARYHTVTANVRQAAPTPRLELAYSWRNDLAELHTTQQLVSGPALTTPEPFWATIPAEITAALFGIIASVATTAATRLLVQYLERRAQRQVNQRRVLGLLSFMLTRAKYAVDHSESLDLGPLETLMKEEPLYATLDRHNLARDVQKLWEDGEAHNHGLTEPDGLQRSKQLRATTEQLREKLNRLKSRSSYSPYH
jgi:hypothetical protein